MAATSTTKVSSKPNYDYTSKGFCLNQFIQDNQAFILKMAHKYSHMSKLDVEDLFQEGAFGMTRAYEKFDQHRGIKFLTYAYYWCDQYQREFCFKNVSQVHVPKAIQIDQTKNDTEEHPSKSRQLVNMFKRMVRLDDEENFAEPVSEFNVEEHLNKAPITEKTRQALKDLLDKDEYFIIKLRYGLEDPYCFTLERIGDIIGCTREWIRIKEKKAIEKLKFFFSEEDEWIN